MIFFFGIEGIFLLFMFVLFVVLVKVMDDIVFVNSVIGVIDELCLLQLEFDVFKVFVVIGDFDDIYFVMIVFFCVVVMFEFVVVVCNKGVDVFNEIMWM